MRYSDGRVYTGSVRNDQMHGKGSMKYKKGRIVNGIWENGKLVRKLKK